MSKFTEFGVVLPNLAIFGGDPAGYDQLISYASAARSLGFRSAWAADHIMHEVPGHYAPAVLQAVAAAVPDIKVCFGTMPAFVRHPLVAAKVIYTLQILSEGRLEVALSIGDERPEMRALGVDPAQRGRRLDETLEILSRLASEEEVTYRGEHYAFERARIRPRPPEGHLPPLFIGSWTGKKSLKRIIHYGTGWMASGLFSKEEDMRAGMESLREAAIGAGRPVPRTIITNVLTYISENEAELARARRLLGGPHDLQDSLGMRLIGPIGLVQERLAQIESIGFERLNVLPVGFDTNQLEAFMSVAA